MFPFVRGQRNRKTCIFLQLRYIISLRIQFGPPAYNSGRLLFLFPWHYSRPVCKICVIWNISPVDSFSLAQLGFQLIWKDSRPIPKKDCKEQFWVHVNQSLWNAGVLISVSALLVSGQAAEGEECVLLFRFLISRPSCDWVWAAGWKIRSDRDKRVCRCLILLIYFTRISEFLYHTAMTECKHAHSGNANTYKETEHTQIHYSK